MSIYFHDERRRGRRQCATAVCEKVKYRASVFCMCFDVHTVLARVSARVEVSAQGCGTKALTSIVPQEIGVWADGCQDSETVAQVGGSHEWPVAICPGILRVFCAPVLLVGTVTLHRREGRRLLLHSNR